MNKFVKKTVSIIIPIFILAFFAFIFWLEFIENTSTPPSGMYVASPQEDSSEVVVWSFKGNTMIIAVYYKGNLVELSEFAASYRWWKHILGPVYWKQDGFLGIRFIQGDGKPVTQHATKTRYVRRGNWDGFFSTRTSRNSTIVFREDGIDFEDGEAMLMTDGISASKFEDAWNKLTTILEQEGRTD